MAPTISMFPDRRRGSAQEYIDGSVSQYCWLTLRRRLFRQRQEGTILSTDRTKPKIQVSCVGSWCGMIRTGDDNIESPLPPPVVSLQRYAFDACLL